jgi:hypothetical protein
MNWRLDHGLPLIPNREETQYGYSFDREDFINSQDMDEEINNDKDDNSSNDDINPGYA